MICNKCGKEIDDRAVLCVHCGNITGTIPGQTPKKKKMRPLTIVAIVLGVLVSVVIGGIIAATTFNSDMKNAAAYIESKDFAAAEEILEKQLSINGEQAKVYLLYADYYTAQNQYDQAVEILEKGLKKYSSNNEIQKKIDQIKSDYADEIKALQLKKQQEEKEKQAQKQQEQQQQQKAKELQQQQEKDAYIQKCQTVAYKDLARNPEKYKGLALTYTGKISQVIEPTFGNTVTLRIDVTKTDYDFYEDTIYATVKLAKEDERLLENDIITFYGECDGMQSYTSILGQKISIPKIDIRYFSRVK